MHTQIQAPACAINTTPNKENVVKRFVRRLKQTVAPTRCRVRWDSRAKAWAVLEENTIKPKRHFDFGFMVNVKLEVRRIQEGSGCGASVDYVGIATGDLVENSFGFGQSHVGLQNLDFKGASGFVDGSGNPLDSVSHLRLLEDRKAVWK